MTFMTSFKQKQNWTPLYGFSFAELGRGRGHVVNGNEALRLESRQVPTHWRCRDERLGLGNSSRNTNSKKSQPLPMRVKRIKKPTLPMMARGHVRLTPKNKENKHKTLLYFCLFSLLKC
jgi:hypothetical protein